MPEPAYPLELVFCPACTLVQITETVPPDVLYRHYAYFSSYSDTILRESRGIAERMIRERGLHARSHVVEIASNDGYLLQFYKNAGIPVLGIEPASNVAAASARRGIPTVCDFFGVELAQRLRATGRRADVIHANNVAAHVANIDDFFAGLAVLLDADGMVVIEVPYVRDMIERAEFDTIYHEHLSYFSLSALNLICERHGLAISDVQRLAIHGGSLRIFLAHAAPECRPHPSVCEMLQDEKLCGLTAFRFYEKFSAKVNAIRERLLAQLRLLKSQGARIAAYGASAKGSTLLNYCGIDGAILEFVVDRNPAKFGLYTPGAHLPIGPVGQLLEAMPDYALLLTWNFAEEILEQQGEYRRRGGRFIVPIPEIRII